MKIALLLLLLTTVSGAIGEPRSVVIPVRGMPAAALVDTLRPLLAPDGHISAHRDQLLIRGTAAQIEAVQALLARLDRPPRRLIIEVRHSSTATASRQNISPAVNGAAPVAAMGYRQLQTRGQSDHQQRVQALDGHPVLIRSGQAVPVYRTHQQISGNGFVQGFQMQLRESMSGFQAVPHVHGNQVTLEIQQLQEYPGDSGRFHRQQASSVLRGSLGEWLTLAASGTTDSDQAVGYHAQTRRSDEQLIQLRVIAID